MKYRTDRAGNEISQLGYGCMRFTKSGSAIDFPKAERELLLAYEKGINYFDTAYLYPGSEEVLGKVLAKHGLRERVKIATKLPQYMTKNIADVDKIFKEELRRLQTEYVDYYLMHMFTDISEWEKLDAMGMREWIADRKGDGSIRNIGFSYHGDTDMFLKILDAYDWDFCQIQYNYLDEHTQAGRRGLDAARGKGIPVVIMEPLRGGKLVNIPEKAKEIMTAGGKNWSPAEWGLRWLWNQKGILCVLSGMNSTEMVEENTRVASEAEVDSFSPEDFAVIEGVRSVIREKEKVRCTGCRYCVPCPMGVDIPGTFYYYNLMYMEGKKFAARVEFAQNIGLREKPGFASQCVGCGKCEQHCPQHLPIREKLKEADKALRPFPYNILINLAKKFILRNKRNTNSKETRND